MRSLIAKLSIDCSWQHWMLASYTTRPSVMKMLYR